MHSKQMAAKSDVVRRDSTFQAGQVTALQGAGRPHDERAPCRHAIAELSSEKLS